MSVEAKDCDRWEQDAIETTWDTEAFDRNRFIEAYERYLYIAATSAKSLGSVGAVRLYLSAWRIVQGTATKTSRLRLSAEDALDIVKRERTAARLLWLDAQAARLPKFRRTRANSRLKAKGRNKKG